MLMVTSCILAVLRRSTVLGSWQVVSTEILLTFFKTRFRSLEFKTIEEKLVRNKILPV